jgi:hypothetical protein
VKKELIRLAMKDSLPREIVERPKTPFPNNPIEALDRDDQWIEGIAKAVPGYIESFVNWRKWCETLYHSKGSLRWIILRPVSLFHWLKAVENR